MNADDAGENGVGQVFGRRVAMEQILERETKAFIETLLRARLAKRAEPYLTARGAGAVPPLRPSERKELEEDLLEDLDARMPAMIADAFHRTTPSHSIAVRCEMVPDSPEEVEEKRLEAERRAVGAPEAPYTVRATPEPGDSLFTALASVARAWAPGAADALARFAAHDLATVALEVELARVAMESADLELRAQLQGYGVPPRRPPSQHPKVVALIHQLWSELAVVMPSERARQRTIAHLLVTSLPGWIGKWQTVRNVIKPKGAVGALNTRAARSSRSRWPDLDRPLKTTKRRRRSNRSS